MRYDSPLLKRQESIRRFETIPRVHSIIPIRSLVGLRALRSALGAADILAAAQQSRGECALVLLAFWRLCGLCVLERSDACHAKCANARKDREEINAGWSCSA